jgi:CarD family transcriptional regulator
MFNVGDAVVHPACGAGVVVGYTEVQWDGNTKQYYDIELIGESSSNLMLPVDQAEASGLRPVVSQPRLKQVWRTLRSDPDTLSEDHKIRYSELGIKLQGGIILRIAEAVRDLAGRRQERNKFTAKEKQLFDRAVTLLAAEIAAVQSTDIDEARSKIRTLLQDSQLQAAT